MAVSRRELLQLTFPAITALVYPRIASQESRRQTPPPQVLFSKDGEIYLLNTYTRKHATLTDQFDGLAACPVWSPTGEQIAFLEVDQAPETTEESLQTSGQIIIVDLAGDSVRSIQSIPLPNEKHTAHGIIWSQLPDLNNQERLLFFTTDPESNPTQAWVYTIQVT